MAVDYVQPHLPRPPGRNTEDTPDKERIDKLEHTLRQLINELSRYKFVENE